MDFDDDAKTLLRHIAAIPEDDRIAIVGTFLTGFAARFERPQRLTKEQEYFDRRDRAWCAAYAAAIVQLKLQHASIDETTLRARAIALAGLAVAIMPGVPGEDVPR
jgi:hypothetical protein